MPKDITRDEFEKRLKNFFAWTAQRDRPVTSWLSSLESWAAYEYNAERAKERTEERKEKEATK